MRTASIAMGLKAILASPTLPKRGQATLCSSPKTKWRAFPAARDIRVTESLIDKTLEREQR